MAELFRSIQSLFPRRAASWPNSSFSKRPAYGTISNLFVFHPAVTVSLLPLPSFMSVWFGFMPFLAVVVMVVVSLSCPTLFGSFKMSSVQIASVSTPSVLPCLSVCVSV